MTVTSPFRSVLTAIGKMALSALSFSSSLTVLLTFFVFIWFQGSEWNAANFEELQKNKLVVEPVTLSAALCVVACLCIPLTHYKGNI